MITGEVVHISAGRGTLILDDYFVDYKIYLRTKWERGHNEANILQFVIITAVYNFINGRLADELVVLMPLS